MLQQEYKTHKGRLSWAMLHSDLKSKDNPKNLKNPKNEDTPKTKMIPKMRMTPKLKMTPKVKTTQKVKTIPKMKTTPKTGIFLVPITLNWVPIPYTYYPVPYRCDLASSLEQGSCQILQRRELQRCTFGVRQAFFSVYWK